MAEHLLDDFEVTLLATLAANKTIVDESSTRTALAELTTTD